MKKLTKDDLAAAKLRLFQVMIQHIGPENKIGMGELFEAVFERTWHHRINDTKALRRLITELRKEGQPVMSNSSRTNGGYWLAASASEISEYTDRRRSTALGVLSMIAAMKRVSLSDYLGQLRLELEADNET